MLLILGRPEPVFTDRSVRTSSGYQVETGNILPVGYGSTQVQSVPFSSANPASVVLAIRQGIASTSIGPVQSIPLSVDEVTPVSVSQAILTVMEEPLMALPSLLWDVLLDGVSIKGDVQHVEVTCSQDSVHNSVNIDGAGKQLFAMSNPFANKGTARITVTVGTRTLTFLLEEREGNETAMSLWGRSLSALEDVPFAEEEFDYVLTQPTMASVLAASLLGSRTLTWSAMDYLVPTVFQYSGSPLNGIQRLAETVGATVRSTDDGNLVVRKQYPVRPVHMALTTPVVLYSRTTVLRSLAYAEAPSEGGNKIEVNGKSDNAFTPQMEVEEDSPQRTQDVHVRVFWAGRRPIPLDEYVTDGRVILLAEDLEELIEDEKLSFHDGVASLTKPIYELKELTWIGDQGVDLGFDPHGKELKIAEDAWRLADATYTTKYSRYRLTGHNVPRLLQVLTYFTKSEVSVIVWFDPGDKEVDAIFDELITSKEVAVERGISILDMVAYDTKTFTIESPYNDAAVDGALVALEDGEIGCAGNFHIRSSTITIDGPKVVNRMECVQCQL